MSFDADLTACAALVEKVDPDRFAAAMANPVAARRVLFALYAFAIEVSRAPWVTQETMIAEMRLQWWRDALEEMAKGGPVRRHEVIQPLDAILDPTGADVLDRLVAARRWDIYKDPFENEAHFHRYLDETAGAVMWVAARALGSGSEHEGAVRSLGLMAGLARYFVAVPELEARGRIPLVDGRPDAVAALSQHALANCDPRQVWRALPPEARPALTEAFISETILKQAARSPQLVSAGRLAVNPLRRSFLLWRWS